nr:hypothetical protein [Streptantibioticus silvisoli]
MSRPLDFVAAAQEADSGRPVRRRSCAPDSLLEWRPVLTVEALLTLRRHGRPIA